MYADLIDKAADFNGDAFRNVASIVVSEDLLDDLSAAAEDRAFGEEIVTGLAEGSRFDLPIIHRPFLYGVGVDQMVQGFKTRFSDGTRYAVWYGSLDLLTTVYETAHHFTERIRDMQTDIAEAFSWTSETSIAGTRSCSTRSTTPSRTLWAHIAMTTGRMVSSLSRRAAGKGQTSRSSGPRFCRTPAITATLSTGGAPARR